MTRAILCTLLLVACGPAKQPPPEDPDFGPASNGECPASWADAVGGDNGQLCDRADAELGLRCTYPEGRCRCGWPEECGLGDIEIGPYTPSSWQCAWAEGVERTDGCPGGASPKGQACDDAGQECAYNGECCYEELICRDGTWALSYGGCPRPEPGFSLP